MAEEIILGEEPESLAESLLRSFTSKIFQEDTTSLFSLEEKQTWSGCCAWVEMCFATGIYKLLIRFQTNTFSHQAYCVLSSLWWVRNPRWQYKHLQQSCTWLWNEFSLSEVTQPLPLWLGCLLVFPSQWSSSTCHPSPCRRAKHKTMEFTIN